MIDFTIIFVGIGLVATGAIFIGYPIGFNRGHRQGYRQALRDAGRHEPVIIRRARRRINGRDVLNAEVIE
ncbi:MAG: hypothetical protein AB7Q37_18915 [Pyrinomonadaceae bacterium]